jgi:hypothetical protein
MDLEMSVESYHDMKKRIPRELDERLEHCSKEGTTRMETALYAFMQECGMSGEQIADRECLVELFASYLTRRFPLMNLPNSQVIEIFEQFMKDADK